MWAGPDCLGIWGLPAGAPGAYLPGYLGPTCLGTWGLGTWKPG